MLIFDLSCCNISINIIISPIRYASRAAQSGPDRGDIVKEQYLHSYRVNVIRSAGMSAAERHLRQDQDVRSDPSQGLSKHRSEAQLSLSRNVNAYISSWSPCTYLFHVVLTFLQTFFFFL